MCRDHHDSVWARPIQRLSTSSTTRIGREDGRLHEVDVPTEVGAEDVIMVFPSTIQLPVASRHSPQELEPSVRPISHLQRSAIRVTDRGSVDSLDFGEDQIRFGFVGSEDPVEVESGRRNGIQFIAVRIHSRLGQGDWSVPIDIEHSVENLDRRLLRCSRTAAA